MVQSGRYPDYSTIQAIVRDSIVHRLHWIADNDDDERLKHEVSVELQKAELERAEGQRQAMADLTSRAVVLLGVAAAEHDWWMVAEQVDRCRDAMSQLRDPYRQQMAQLISKYMVLITENLPDE